MADMKNPFAEIIKQAQQVQESIQKAQSDLANFTVVGSAGVDNETIKVTVSGLHQVNKVEISPELYAKGREPINQFFMDAFNQAVEKVKSEAENKMASLMEGMALPPELTGLSKDPAAAAPAAPTLPGPFGELMQQAQKMQEDLKQTQQELANFAVIGKSGAEPTMAKVKMNGEHKIEKVGISQQAYKDGREIVEELLSGAVNDAVEEVKRESERKMTSLLEAVKFPKDFNFDDQDDDLF